MEELRQGPTISGLPPVLKQHNAPSQPQASGGSTDSDSAATLFVLGTMLGLRNHLEAVGGQPQRGGSQEEQHAVPKPSWHQDPQTGLRPQQMAPPGQPEGLDLPPDDLREVRAPGLAHPSHTRCQRGCHPGWKVQAMLLPVFLERPSHQARGPALASSLREAGGGQETGPSQPDAWPGASWK